MQKAVELSRARIAQYVHLTPCHRSQYLCDRSGAEVHIKLENLQTTGSFKLRGVINKILSLDDGDIKRPLVTASTGNHGAAFAHTVQEFNLNGRLFMPETAARVKMDKLRKTGIPLELVGQDCVEAERHAAAFALEHNCIWVSPYNDLEVVHGQGTVAVEILEQLTKVDVVLVPVGGGGLISGIAGYLKSRNPEIRIIGCQPRNSCVMYQSIEKGRILDVPSLPTLSDGTAGGIEEGSITFDLCRTHVDEFILVEEDEISSALGRVFDHEAMAIEGAGALPVAALLGSDKRFAGQQAVLVASGGNVDEEIVRGFSQLRDGEEVG